MFEWPWTKTHLKTFLKREKMLENKNFSFSNVFYPTKDRNHHLSYIQVALCKYF